MATTAETRSPLSSDLTLLIYSPAFGLPSSDPACLSALAYISKSVPRGSWALEAGTPDEVGASELPALVTRNGIIEGLDNILHHLSSHYTDLDASLPSSMARADALAFTSHTTSHLSPLLALSLYVSSVNYTGTTRHAISTSLPFPLAYTILPSLRDAAKARSQHLNLSSLDLKAISSTADSQKTARSIIPSSLRSGMRKGVTETIIDERTALRFRLDGLVDAACAPLSRLLGEKRWFMSESEEEAGMSSLDAVVLGFLALALLPDVPQPWFKDRLEQRYPTLCAFVTRGVRDAFGGRGVTPAMAQGEGEGGGAGTLPWKAHTPSPLATRVAAVATAVVWRLVEYTPFPQSKIKISPNEEPSLVTTLMVPVAVGAAAVTALVGAVMVIAELGSVDTGTSLEQMGEAGAIFQGMDFGGGANESERMGRGRGEVGGRIDRVSREKHHIGL